MLNYHVVIVETEPDAMSGLDPQPMVKFLQQGCCRTLWHKSSMLHPCTELPGWHPCTELPGWQQLYGDVHVAQQAQGPACYRVGHIPKDANQEATGTVLVQVAIATGCLKPALWHS